MDDIAGKTAEAERKFAAEIKEGADDDEKEANEQQHAAEVAKRIHKKSVENQAREVKEIKEVKDKRNLAAHPLSAAM